MQSLPLRRHESGCRVWCYHRLEPGCRVCSCQSRRIQFSRHGQECCSLPLLHPGGLHFCSGGLQHRQLRPGGLQLHLFCPGGFSSNLVGFICFVLVGFSLVCFTLAGSLLCPFFFFLILLEFLKKEEGILERLEQPRVIEKVERQERRSEKPCIHYINKVSTL